jgi:hypothetical protein
LPVQVFVTLVAAIQTILVAALDFDYADHTLTPFGCRVGGDGCPATKPLMLPDFRSMSKKTLRLISPHLKVGVLRRFFDKLLSLF